MDAYLKEVRELHKQAVEMFKDVKEKIILLILKTDISKSYKRILLL